VLVSVFVIGVAPVLFGQPTLLHAVGESSDVSLILDLLENGADISAVNEFGETALHIAAIRKDIQVLNTLIEHGADVDAFTSGTYEGHSVTVTRTPLMWMVYHCEANLILPFIESGANLNLVSEEGETVLDLALGLGARCEDVTQALLLAGGRRGKGEQVKQEL